MSQITKNQEKSLDENLPNGTNTLIQAGIDLFKVSNGDIRTVREIFSKLTTKTTE